MRKPKMKQPTEQIVELATRASVHADQALFISRETRPLLDSSIQKAAAMPAPPPVQTPPIMPNWGERLLTRQERNAIETLLYFKAGETKLPANAVEKDLEVAFGVEEHGFGHLKAWNFDDAIRFLVEYEPNDQPAGV